MRTGQRFTSQCWPTAGATASMGAISLLKWRYPGTKNGTEPSSDVTTGSKATSCSSSQLRPLASCLPARRISGASCGSARGNVGVQSPLRVIGYRGIQSQSQPMSAMPPIATKLCEPAKLRDGHNPTFGAPVTIQLGHLHAAGNLG